MKQIKNIVFDFGGVLVDWNPRYLYRDYFKNDGEMEYFLGNICTLEWNSQFDKGASFVDGVQAKAAQHPEYKEAIELYWAEWPKTLGGCLSDSVDLMRELKAKGYKVYGLTNWSAETIGFAFRKFDFFQEFDGIVISGVEKLIKPDGRLYQVLLERYGLAADECVFIDDNITNVNAAIQAGMNGIPFDNIGHVREQLDALQPTANSSE